MQTRLLLPALALLAACGPQPPTISAISYSPLAVPVGQTTALVIMFSYVDADRDTAESGYSMVDPSGAITTYPHMPLAGTSSTTLKAMASLSISVTPPIPGPYSFEVWVTDLADQESNHLGGVFKAD